MSMKGLFFLISVNIVCVTAHAQDCPNFSDGSYKCTFSNAKPLTVQLTSGNEDGVKATAIVLFGLPPTSLICANKIQDYVECSQEKRNADKKVEQNCNGVMPGEYMTTHLDRSFTSTTLTANTSMKFRNLTSLLETGFGQTDITIEQGTETTFKIKMNIGSNIVDPPINIKEITGTCQKLNEKIP